MARRVRRAVSSRVAVDGVTVKERWKRDATTRERRNARFTAPIECNEPNPRARLKKRAFPRRRASHHSPRRAHARVRADVDVDDARAFPRALDRVSPPRARARSRARLETAATARVVPRRSGHRFARPIPRPSRARRRHRRGHPRRRRARARAHRRRRGDASARRTAHSD